MKLNPSYLIFASMLIISNDWELIIPGEKPICAKSQETCEEAIKAINGKKWLNDLEIKKPAYCQPHPNCFKTESNCIKNFNCETLNTNH